MDNIIIIEDIGDWALEIGHSRVVLARDYIRNNFEQKSKNIRVYNLCRSYRYNSIGYYVSLLATARGHKPSPSVEAIQDLKSVSLVRLASEDLDEKIQQSLKTIKSDHFELSMYFRKNMAKKHETLSRELSRMFEAPLVRAYFKRVNGKWYLRRLMPIGLKEVPKSHLDYVRKAAAEQFNKRHRRIVKTHPRFGLAILVDPNEMFSPSNAGAIKKFIHAASKLGIEAETITSDDYSTLAEYDGLFIRATTAVNHYSFRFSQKANALGMVVMDDPTSILRCANKVYIHDLLHANNLPAPRTLVIDSLNCKQISLAIEYPYILKQPDSAFSRGVVKVDNREEFMAQAKRLLERSDLIIAQQYIPTGFDWRVGILDGKPLFVCKYFMAKDHWQIYKVDKKDSKKVIPGRSETIPVEFAPKKLVDLSIKTARHIGDGLYGLDIKEHNDLYSVIEVNDNPNIDAGVEDLCLGEKLYMDIMGVFLSRMLKKVESING